MMWAQVLLDSQRPGHGHNSPYDGLILSPLTTPENHVNRGPGNLKDRLLVSSVLLSMQRKALALGLASYYESELWFWGLINVDRILIILVGQHRQALF